MDAVDKPKLLQKVYGSYIDVESAANTVHNYTRLAADYENDFVSLGYTTPAVVADTAVELMTSAADDDAATVLDVACGTGLVGVGLRAAGYRGRIDGVDGSGGMLQLAAGKRVYRSLTEQFIFADTGLSSGDGAYDAVVCCGGFGPGHLEPGVLPELARVTKRDGVLVFATRDNEQAREYVRQLDHVIDHLVASRQWSEIKRFRAVYFDLDFCNERQKLHTLIYCYRKL